MDARWCDRLVRFLAIADTRRAVAALLVSLPIGGSLAALLDEAATEAARHPVRRVQGRTARRRTRRRSKRDKRRRRRERAANQDNGQDNGQDDKRRGNQDNDLDSKLLLKGVALRVSPEAGPMLVVFWRGMGGNDPYVFADQALLSEDHTFVADDGLSDSPDALVWIEDRYAIRAFNPAIGLPTVTMGYGGDVKANRTDDFHKPTSKGWVGGTTVVNNQEMMEPRELEPSFHAVMQVDGLKFTVDRGLDSDDYKQFYLTIERS